MQTWDVGETAHQTALFNTHTHTHTVLLNTNSLHILQHYLPGRSSLNYSLRPRRPDKTFIIKTSELNERDFIIRNIYKNKY